MKKLFGTLMVLALMLALLPATATAHTEDDPYEVPLLAGQHINVGVVKVWNDADHLLHVEYVITESGWCITETHLQVATSLDGIPQTKKRNPIPGRFEENDKYNPCVPVAWYTYDLEGRDWTACDQLFIAAHAVVRKTGCKGCGSTETAWGEGQSFDGSNWGMYFTYLVQCPDEPGLVNGGFEAPVVTHSAEWNKFASAQVGWNVAWAGSYADAPQEAYLELHRDAIGWTPREGYQYAELDTDWEGPDGGGSGEQASVSISQDLQTCDGQRYEVSFAYSPRPLHSDNVLEVYWDGARVGTYTADGSLNSNTVWTTITLYQEANGPTTTLQFVEAGMADSLGMFLDAVSVEKCQTCTP